MNFSFSEDQQQVGELARKIFAERASHERQRALERALALMARTFGKDLARELGYLLLIFAEGEVHFVLLRSPAARCALRLHS